MGTSNRQRQEDGVGWAGFATKQVGDEWASGGGAGVRKSVQVAIINRAMYEEDGGGWAGFATAQVGDECTSGGGAGGGAVNQSRHK